MYAGQYRVLGPGDAVLAGGPEIRKIRARFKKDNLFDIKLTF